jgi:hypothetical protein
MSPPRVYKAISALAAELSQTGIPKAHLNLQDEYRYRSIDDVLNRLAPLLPKHRLCVLPTVLERQSQDCVAPGGQALTRVSLKVAYDIVSTIDASLHRVEVFAEAHDEGDKGTAKALSAAYKSAMLQAFCIPVSDSEDSDARSPKSSRWQVAEPPCGWPQWAEDIIATIGICESQDALSRVKKTHRSSLTSLSREQCHLYEQVGAAFASRSRELSLGTAHLTTAKVERTTRPTERLEGDAGHNQRRSDAGGQRRR